MFTDLFASEFSNYRYSLAATGIYFKDKEVNSTRAAEKQMHKFLKKNGLHVIEIWDDHHYKTYICDHGVKFYISRI